jgi:hypothetical protein
MAKGKSRAKSNANWNLIRVGRVLHQDDDFVTIEVGKHDGVTFHLQQNDQGETVGGDKFLTLLFMHNAGDGTAKPWDPFKGGH